MYHRPLVNIITGDIVLTSLIVAIGTRNFRDFSISNFKGRLKYRHAALSAVWALYATNTTEVQGDSREGGLGTEDDGGISSDQNINQNSTNEVMSLSSFVLLGRHLGKRDCRLIVPP